MLLYKVKRELLRLLKNAARDYPNCVPDGLRRSMFARWNCWQRDEEARSNAHPRFESLAPLSDGLTLLNLDFLSGFGETVHPDVIFVPGGWRKKEWRYLMSLTPMPCGAEYFENPEFVVSEDGVNWSLPDGAASPVVSAPDDWLGFNSDPALFLDGDVLYLFYRDIREYAKKDVEVRILAITTQDGIHWTPPVEVLSQHHPRKYPAILMSPTVIKIDKSYYMWFISVESGKYYIFRMTSADLIMWSQPEKASINGLEEGELPWHLDVERDGDKFVMALCMSNSEHFKRKSLCFASSYDDGMMWNVKKTRLRPGYLGFGERSLYRGALVKDTADGEWKLYYSGQDAQKHWRTVVTNVKL